MLLFSKFAQKLLDKGALTNLVCDNNQGNTLVHCLIQSSQENAAIYLMETDKVDVNATNKIGESPLHLSAQQGFHRLAQTLIQKGSNPNLQTVFKSTGEEYFRQTPLHTAITCGNNQVIDVILEAEDIDLDMKNSAGKKYFSDLESGLAINSNIWTEIGPYMSLKRNLERHLNSYKIELSSKP